MRIFLSAALIGLGMSGAAFAAEPPVKPAMCCCEKMRESGKDCCPKKPDAADEGHADHTMDAPKS